MTYFASLVGRWCLASLSGLLVVGAAEAAARPKPLRVLLVAGGCCHDYEKQKKILADGLTARANVEITTVHEGTDREHKVALYEKADWSNGYDVVVHDECFGAVTDDAFVERITAPHTAGLPAVMLHCSTHTYRAAKTDEWRRTLGISSFSHETRRDFTVKNLKPDHPIMKGFPMEWPDAQDELYKNEKLWPGMVPLAQAHGQETQKDHFVIWLNTSGKERVFSTTLGHGNETVQSDTYLGLVTRGLLWACGKLGPDGKPTAGYGPAQNSR